MPDPLNECTVVQKLILCGLMLSPRVTLSRLDDVLRRIDSPFSDPKFTVDLRGALRVLNGRRLVNAVQADGEILYSPVLSIRQQVHLAGLPEFQALLHQKRKMLRMVYTGEIYRVSEEQKTSMAAVLAAFILLGDSREYKRSSEFFARYDAFPEIRQNALRSVAGRTDSYPAVLSDDFFPEVFPFLAWNSLLLGGSASALIEKFFSLYPDHVPDGLSDPLIFLLLWNGRRDFLRKIGAAGALAFLDGSWEEAWKRFSARLSAVGEQRSSRDVPPMLLLTTYLAGILARRPAPELRSFPEEIMRNTALNSRDGMASCLAELLKSVDAVYRSGGKMDVPCDPEHQPVFCNMLKAVFLALTRETPLPSACASAYFALLEQLERKEQLLTASWLVHALAVLSEKESVERAYAESFDAAHPDLSSFISPQSLKPRWQLGLDALKELLRAGDGDAPGASSGPEEEYVLSWRLYTRPAGDAMILESIRLFRHVLSPEGIPGKGHPVSAKEFADGVFADHLTPGENAVRRFVKTGTDQDSIDPRAVEKLADSPRVFLDGSETPVTLRKGVNGIRSERAPDGSLRLSLRFRCDERRPDAVLLYRDEAGNLCWVLPDAHAKRLNAVFDSFGSGGFLDVPENEKTQLLDALTSSGRAGAVSGVLRQELLSGGTPGQGAVSLVVEVRETLSGRFVFALKNCPDPARKPWRFIPGEGEELVCPPEGGSCLRRDLAGERKAADDFAERCPSLSGRACGLLTWDGGALPEVLPLLAEIQDSAVPVDWISPRGVRLVRPAPDALTFHGFSSGDGSWFTAEGSFQADPEHVLSLSALLDAAEQADGPFLKTDERSYIRLTGSLKDRIEALSAACRTRTASGAAAFSPASLPALLQAFGDGGLPASLADRIRHFRAAFEAEYNVPETFAGTLRPYQREGFTYLARMAEAGLGCCLADDMGLGKTVEILALLLSRAEKGPALVVAPASVCRNWENEAHRFAPSLRVSLPGPKDREETVRRAAAYDVVVISYGLLLSEEALFRSRRWHAVVLDEAQNIKNSEARRAKAARGLQADVRIAATGTPVENRLQDLWSIFDFLNPGMLGTEKDFEARFCRADSVPESLRRLVSPLILRRLKKDVLSDLPEKTESVLDVDFSPEERELYETLRRKAVESLRGRSSDRFAVLAHLTKLRRACCHPSLILPSFEGGGSKLRQIADLAETLRDAGHRALIFSQFVDFLTLVRAEFERRSLTFQYLDGSTPSDERQTRVRSFQEGTGDFFLISLKAGGTGLNLTGADYVILCDPWWNPAAEDQAADRAHRIGQKNPVTVYRLVVSGTVEEKVLALHDRKRFLADSILSGAAHDGVSAEEMFSLLE